MNGFEHIPVLMREVCEGLTFAEGPARLIDGTLGGAGHSAMLLEKYPKLELLGIDRDEMALEAAAERLAFAAGRVTLVRGNYSELNRIAASCGWDGAEGVLLDIGISSPQIDLPERGFSWRSPGPLDMRMDRRSELTAGRLLNQASEQELTRIFREYGEMKPALKFARAVVARRREIPFGTTDELVALCDEVLGKSRPGKLPQPTLVFQALRIAVNDELGELERGLRAAESVLTPGGRMAVISFHSLEDRMVKNFFREESTGCVCPPGLPICCCNHRAELRIVTRHALYASEEELAVNRRSASAKLRIAEKI